MSRLTERRREVVADLMKDAVYEAALNVLAEHGPRGFTMDRVAEAAGVAKGSLYNYFRSKRALLVFVYERLIAPATRVLDEVMEQPTPAPEKLRIVLRTWLAYFAEHAGWFRFVFDDAGLREMLKDTEQTARAIALRRLTRIVEQGVAEGVFRPLPAEAVAEMLLGAVREAIEQGFTAPRRRSADETVEQFLDVFVRGIGAAGGQRAAGAAD